jgi:predicted metal-dependent HD superfamily phosphohydrolase
MQVSRAWSDIAHRHRLAGAMAEDLLGELKRAYGEPHRHYHTLEHIASLLQLLGEHGREVVDHDALVLAILFHDVVYDPARSTNEEASAALAAERLARLGLRDQLIAKVERYILATRHGQAAAVVDDADLALLLDLDLAILAAPPVLYRAYAQAIRREHVHVPDALYRAGRRRVLEEFLARERIYRTKLRALWEEPARANLAGEMAELSA